MPVPSSQKRIVHRSLFTFVSPNTHRIHNILPREIKYLFVKKILLTLREGSRYYMNFTLERHLAAKKSS